MIFALQYTERDLLKAMVQKIASEQVQQAKTVTTSIDVAAAGIACIRSSRSAQIKAASASNTTAGTPDEDAV